MLFQYLPGKLRKGILSSGKGMNRWFPQPSCMAEPVYEETHFCAIMLNFTRKNPKRSSRHGVNRV